MKQNRNWVIAMVISALVASIINISLERIFGINTSIAVCIALLVWFLIVYVGYRKEYL